MESRIITPGPYRATKLWNEVTKYFRAGMPLKKHRQNFKTYGNCFTSADAIDWLHHLLKNNSNFGSEVTRQQTIQLLRKFLKNHVIEDLKGRWGTEDLDDNHQLFRFPSTSPIKTIPSRQPLWKRSSLENVFKEKENLFKMPHFSKRTPKRRGSLDGKGEHENEAPEVMEVEKESDNPGTKELTKKDEEDIWGNIALIHLQKILALPTLDEVLNPAQINPGHIMYNMTHTSKHGVVFLKDRTDDLPHWVLSAMKCLANWPNNNDLSQPTYPGFERDVFRTVADYFLNLPQPLLTYEYYELFVNILVVCGYITVPHRRSRKHKVKKEAPASRSSQSAQLSNTNFKSTECLLLSLVRKVPNEEEEEDDDQSFGELGREHKDIALHNTNREKLYNSLARRPRDGKVMGGSCQNLATCRKDCNVPSKVRLRSCSMEAIVDVSYSESDSPEACSPVSQTLSPNLPPSDHVVNNVAAPAAEGNARALQHHHSAAEGAHRADCRALPRSQSLGDCLGSCTSINTPVAEITIKPGQAGQGRLQKRLSSIEGSEGDDPGIAVTKRLCQSNMELSSSVPSNSSALHASQSCTGTPSLLQPHLERVAIDALQLCCLLLPPPNRRKLQLLMRMISRMSQNVDMPRLHDAMGTRSLMIQTFSRCVLCCAEEVDLDELLATRLVSFLMDHHQEVLQVPCYLQTAVQDHIQYLRSHMKDLAPGFYFCKQISTREFEEQKVVTSQAAIMELLESIVKDKNLSVKDKKKKLKQFQKEYPEIYRSRFPTTESEAKLFGDKPTIKQPMLVLKRPKFRNLRY
ncbi:DEP domain-containing protein 1A isoform X2 [Bufo gargarizans]|uniref:DEP domain-containing protein 1A isoform X2 n=1 Tax=Bufo gargarizans TaxID=30331 RepID=UPI001CF5AB83|nr:DEP domain-containing protein 1A isoform X2 [Bufo gargarizans]